MVSSGSHQWATTSPLPGAVYCIDGYQWILVGMVGSSIRQWATT
jgi:hypothetical protein